MRFIGNKELIVNEIRSLLESKDLLRGDLTLFDAFCGTGAVADSLKDSVNLVVNDMIDWSVIYSRGRITSSRCTFKKLGFDPFDFLNSNKTILKGFFYKNYSPGGSERMYFSPENAGRIDYFRKTIEKWRAGDLINEDEYSYLLASLIESISFVSNTAGVYGAFLKHWDSRSKKNILFQKVESSKENPLEVTFLNGKIEDIINEIDCDILYLDPPYTQNQYGTQYHILQTLVLNDKPSISAITGSRPTTLMRSDWSKDLKSHILFDKVIAKTKAKYIVFSYSTDGFLSKRFIEASLKRYGKLETYECHKISYGKYTNFKSRSKKDHYEYLFFIEKKELKDIKYESPLNYIGSKAKMIGEIKSYLPKDIDTFIDAFGGGFNVGINSSAKNILYNDINYFVKELVESFRSNDTYLYIMYMKKMIKKFNLQAQNLESYVRARSYYNSLPINKRDPRLLFTVILYGFNQQIRFNGDHCFNNPVGMRWFNDKVLEKMISFSRKIKEENTFFMDVDCLDLNKFIDSKTFVYLDPPYRLTTGSYNDGKRGFKGWEIESEIKFLDFVDRLNKNSIPFMISYIIEHKGKTNVQFKHWIEQNNYQLIHICNTPGLQREEVLIINYDVAGETSLYNQEQISKRWTVSEFSEPTHIG